MVFIIRYPTTIPSAENHGECLDMPPHIEVARLNIYSTKVTLCIWLNQLGTTSTTITGDRYRTQLMLLS